jgi:hypothetical protein
VADVPSEKNVDGVGALGSSHLARSAATAAVTVPKTVPVSHSSAWMPAAAAAPSKLRPPGDAP